MSPSRLLLFVILLLSSACDVLNIEDELFEIEKSNQRQVTSDRIIIDKNPDHLFNCYPEIYVNTTTQDNHQFDICDGVGDCNLVDAIETANLCFGTTVIHLQEGTTYYLEEPAYFNAREREDGSYEPVTSRQYKGNGLPEVNSNIVIEGHGATIKRGKWSFGRVNIREEIPSPKEIVPFRIFMNEAFGTLTLKDVKIIGGHAQEDTRTGGNGGAIYNEGKLILENVSIEHNEATNSGGGIFSYGNRSVDIIGVSIYSNTSAFNGGGIYCHSPLVLTKSTISRNNSSKGAGLYLGYADDLMIPNDSKTLSSSALIDQCIIEKNQAASHGGGIFTNISEKSIDGYPMKFGSLFLEIQRSTLSENKSTRGGGIMNWSSVIYLKDVSIIANQATNNYEQGAGGGMHFEFGHVFLNNSVLALNSIGGDVGGLTANATHIQVQNKNFISDQTFSDSNILHGNPMLNPISVYGNTKVYIPMSGSPLINAGNIATLLQDQRGITRSLGTSNDIGAVEVQ